MSYYEERKMPKSIPKKPKPKPNPNADQNEFGTELQEIRPVVAPQPAAVLHVAVPDSDRDIQPPHVSSDEDTDDENAIEARPPRDAAPAAPAAPNHQDSSDSEVEEVEDQEAEVRALLQRMQLAIHTIDVLQANAIRPPASVLNIPAEIRAARLTYPGNNFYHLVFTNGHIATQASALIGRTVDAVRAAPRVETARAGHPQYTVGTPYLRLHSSAIDAVAIAYGFTDKLAALRGPQQAVATAAPAA